ncbi:MAG: invasion associated locus B family protein [Paracoccaceae bacterium]
MLKTTFGSSLGAVILALGLSCATTGMAQQTEEPAQTTNDLSLGEPADGTVELGTAYAKEAIGDWELRCLRTEDPANDPCQMYQLLKDQNDSPVAEVSIFRLINSGQAKAGATIIVPLETALQSQLTISVDGNKAKRYPFAFCNTLGCYARIGLTEDDVSAYKRGNAAQLTIVPAMAPDQKVNLAMSLSGFTKSFDLASAVEQ